MCHGHTATGVHVGTQSISVESGLNISERQGETFSLASEIIFVLNYVTVPPWARAIEWGDSLEAFEYLLEKELRGALPGGGGGVF